MPKINSPIVKSDVIRIVYDTLTEGMSVVLVYADDTEVTLTEADYKTELFDEEAPVSAEELTWTVGTKTIQVTLNNKNDVSASLDVAVFSYITSVEFAFEAIESKAECKMTGFVPQTDLRGRTVKIPETITVNGHVYTVTPPQKTEYVLGDELDTTGMVVAVVLADGGSAAGQCGIYRRRKATKHLKYRQLR